MSNHYHQAVTTLGIITRLAAACLLLISVGLVAPLRAETITIFKGSGIVWEGMPFDVTLSGPTFSMGTSPERGLASITTLVDRCMTADKLENIAGYLALKLAPGVGLVPRATVSVRYALATGLGDDLNGTIGLPETKGIAGKVSITNPVSNRQWCLPPRLTKLSGFYNGAAIRTSRGVGNWVIVADGTQAMADIKMKPLYYGSFSLNTAGDLKREIFPSDIKLRISTLECTVQTTTNIDFGAVSYSKKVGAEIGKQSYPLVVDCGQVSNFISANINLQVRALSGLYNGQTTRLALTQGGGYITGEIDPAPTGMGSGACNLETGLPFNNSRVKIGNITSAESSKLISKRVTWRLCSGGSRLPVGPVTASAEMMVTFN